MLDDGSYELKVPYSSDPELLMDVLKYGGDCEVIAPPDLKNKVITEAKLMAAIEP